MQNDILFDNIYIGHSIDDAESFKTETFDIKHAVEKREEEASEKKAEKDKPKSPMDLNFFNDPVHYVREKLDLFMTIAKNDPVQAVKFVPEVAAGLGLLALAIIATLVGVASMAGGSAAVPPKVKDAAQTAKDKAAEAKDKVVDATASGAEKVRDEVQKRTTRSSAAAQEATAQ